MGCLIYVVKAKEDDTKQFMQVIANHQGILFKVCLMFAAPKSEELRDLYNDIVCRLWEGWPSFDYRSSEGTWVYKVALNTALNQQRKERRRPTIVLVEDGAMKDLCEERENDLTQELYRLAERLQPEEKALLRLYLDKKKQKEIAEIMGISEMAVQSRFKRMKQKLIKYRMEESL